MTERRKYTEEFKREAVQLSEKKETSIAAVARELGIRPNILYRWREDVLQKGGDAFPGHGNIGASEAETYRLRKELERVKRERDILKKALAIFSQGR